MLDAARISSKDNRAVLGSNSLTVNVHASHRSAIAVPDYSCSLKNEEIFFTKK